jgi:PTH1 family peptidyl-tRNA hydrolase
MADRYLIVGLGNPGATYATTRHNIGFMAVDELARRYSMTLAKTEKKAQTADGIIMGKRVLLIKPQTYMNESGVSVRGLADFYEVALKDILVISDDLDLPLGTLRLRMGGGHGGQNGIRSIISHMGSPDFPRVRCGIGRPPGTMNAADYVLRPFGGDDQITARIVIERAADAVETWLREGIDLAMTRHNGNVEQVPR